MKEIAPYATVEDIVDRLESRHVFLRSNNIPVTIVASKNPEWLAIGYVSRGIEFPLWNIRLPSIKEFNAVKRRLFDACESLDIQCVVPSPEIRRKFCSDSK